MSFLSRRTVLAGAAAAFASFAPAHAATFEEIKKRGYLLVATEDDFKPFEFVQDGKPAGFDNGLLELLRKYAPFEVRQDIIPWTGLLAGVSTGKYDVALTAALITNQRYLKFQLLRAAASSFCVGYPRMALIPPRLRSV